MSNDITIDGDSKRLDRYHASDYEAFYVWLLVEECGVDEEKARQQFKRVATMGQ